MKGSTDCVAARMLSIVVWSLFFAIFGVHASDHYQCEPSTDVIVDFFGWTYEDIARECTGGRMKGVCAVQVPNPIEHQWDNGTAFQYGTWHQRHRPVSYHIAMTDSGSRINFDEMVTACTTAGFRVYADVEVNHMTTEKGEYGSGGSWYNPSDPFYPAVPYDPAHFNADECDTFTGDIEDFENLQQVRFCRLYGQNDLKTSSSYVRGKIANKLNALVNDFGVAGFRFAHSRFVEPADLEAIAAQLDPVISWPGELQPFIYQEVLDDGSGLISCEDYDHIGRVEENRAGRHLTETLLHQHLLANLSDFGEGMGFCNSSKAVVYLDDPSSQRGYYTGIEDEVFTFRNVSEYITATAFMLSWDYGFPKVLSSYEWTRAFFEGNDINSPRGPPRDESGKIKPVVPSSDGFSCEEEWNCEHRWKAIANMIDFHSFLREDDINSWWTNGYHQIAYGRGTRGFVVINNEEAQDLDFWLQTPMPEGTYCDIITGTLGETPCSGRSVDVDTGGWGHFNITKNDPFPIIAIVIEPEEKP